MKVPGMECMLGQRPQLYPSWMAQPRAAAKPCKVESHQILALGPALFFCRDKGSGSHMLSFALQLSQSLLTVTSFLWMSFGAHILSMVPPLPPDMTTVAFGQLVFQSPHKPRRGGGLTQTIQVLFCSTWVNDDSFLTLLIKDLMKPIVSMILESSFQEPH